MSLPPPLPLAARINRPGAALQANPVKPQDWIFRVVIAVLLLGSLALTWWSFNVRLAPLQAQARELSTKVGQLSTEVDELERTWAKARADEISNRLHQAHSQLFIDQASLENWMANLQEQAEPLALEAKANFGKTIPQNVIGEELAIIPTSIAVDVHPTTTAEVAGSPYRRILQLTQRLAAETKRADLAEVKVEGGPNSVGRAMLTFELWAGTGGGK